ncbi:MULTISPECIES: element excision factor XisI family protein [Moorena]|uniref:Element excision factor XisI family protein n=1 Tax=Moorena producens (strain JHB) TaxID=1454205 RepID=A0A9Q9STL6_MOOP1|nr:MULTISPECIES: element excision factor XisI family protein [Moorena]NEQ15285.1 hypothetical protein [Moorena sp. SIO3E2]NER88446.1 hypothetical protein [Moorena sp. SIO3A2]WAN69430.1 element excision factor XisI family protein [Moorena producens JHB]
MAVEESVEQYRQWIQELLLERANRKRTFPEIEAQAVLDTERDHYLLLHTGWKDNRRTHGCSLHLDIKNVDTPRPGRTGILAWP